MLYADLCLLLYLLYPVHRQASQQVHQDDHHQENEEKEEDIAEEGAGLEADARVVKLTSEHGEGLDKGKSRVVERILALPVPSGAGLVKEDVEAETEGDQEEGVPDKEGGKSLENPEEHGGVDVVSVEEGMTAEHEKQLHPGEKQDGSLETSLVVTTLEEEQEAGDDDLSNLEMVFQATDVLDWRSGELEEFSANKDDPEESKENPEGPNIAGEDVGGESGNKEESEEDVEVVDAGDASPLESQEAGQDRVLQQVAVLLRLGQEVQGASF